jgi:hypothetical protein
MTADHVSLGQETIGALRLVKESIRIQGSGQVSAIPVTHRMLQPARSAYSVYKDHLEKEKAALLMQRKSIHQEREKLLEKEKKKCEAEKSNSAEETTEGKVAQGAGQKQTEQSSALKTAEGLLVEAETNCLLP